MARKTEKQSDTRSARLCRSTHIHRVGPGYGRTLPGKLLLVRRHALPRPIPGPRGLSRRMRWRKHAFRHRTPHTQRERQGQSADRPLCRNGHIHRRFLRRRTHSKGRTDKGRLDPLEPRRPPHGNVYSRQRPACRQPHNHRRGRSGGKVVPIILRRSDGTAMQEIVLRLFRTSSPQTH